MNKNAFTKVAKNAADRQENNRESDFDVLNDFYFGNKDRELSPHQDEVRERWLKSYGLFLRGESMIDIVDILIKDYGISESTAWRDYRSAIKLWSQHEDHLPKKVKRIQLRAMIKETRNEAIEAGNLKARIACEKNLITVDGLQNEDIDLPFDKLELLPSVNILDSASRIFIDTLLQAVLNSGTGINLMNLNENSGISINDIADKIAKDAEDAEFEEIDDENGK